MHDRTLYVRLSCGHERVSRGWRGEAGQRYCCDVCHEMTMIEKVEATTLPPFDWQMCPPFGAVGIPQFAKLPPPADQIKAALCAAAVGDIPVGYVLHPRRWWPSVRWRGRRRLVLRLGRWRVRVVWRREGSSF